jgi:ABC-type Na+ efflux pump permease subunit
VQLEVEAGAVVVDNDVELRRLIAASAFGDANREADAEDLVGVAFAGETKVAEREAEREESVDLDGENEPTFTEQRVEVELAEEDLSGAAETKSESDGAVNE